MTSHTTGKMSVMVPLSSFAAVLVDVPEYLDGRALVTRFARQFAQVGKLQSERPHPGQAIRSVPPHPVPDRPVHRGVPCRMAPWTEAYLSRWDADGKNPS